MIGQGRTAEIYAMEGKALKLFRADMEHKSVEKEYSIGKLISGMGVPSPQVYDMVSIEGRQGIVYQLVAGKTMLEHIFSRPFSLGRHARTLAHLHHGIHQHTVTGMPSQVRSLAEAISKTTALSQHERKAILLHLESLPQGEKLCHGDFHPDNVMVTPAKPIVLDWMNATVGNPAADVARTIILLRDSAPPPGLPGWKTTMLSILRTLFSRAYIREYYRISDLTPNLVEAWLLPVAAARLVEDLPTAEKQTLQRIVRQHL